jgi:hypothetical protein
MDQPLPQLSLKERRDRTIKALCNHYAKDRLEIDEFEARLDTAHRARSHEELAALLQDLPAPPPARPATASAAPPRAAARPARQDRGAAAAPLRETRTVVAIMSGVERRGAWTPAQRNIVMAFMGGVELDFREVDLPPGTTEISAFCLMGGVSVIVPPDLPVDASGIAIMGGFEHSSPRPAEPDSPVLRITGFCMMGGVEVQVRLPGETAADARRREREERRLGRPRQRRRLTDGE